MAASHLVARLNTALNGQVSLDYFQDARCEIVASGDLIFLLFKPLVELALLSSQSLRRLLQLLVGIVIFQTHLEPLLTRDFVKIGLGNLAARLQFVRTALCHLAKQHALDAKKNRLEGSTAGRIGLMVFVAGNQRNRSHELIASDQRLPTDSTHWMILTVLEGIWILSAGPWRDADVRSSQV